MKISERPVNFCLPAITLVVLLIPASSFAQSAEDPDDPADVIDAFLEALGGEMALRGVETLNSKVEYSGWTTGTANFSYKNGKRRESTDYGSGSSQGTIHDGERWVARTSDSAWSVQDNLGNVHTNELDFSLATDAIRMQSQVDQFEIVPKGEFSDHDYSHCVCLQLKEGKEYNILRFFNPETGLMECAERWVPGGDAGQKMHIRIFEMKYEEFEGIMFLKSTRRTLGSEEFLECKYSDFAVDQPVDDELFETEIDDD